MSIVRSGLLHHLGSEDSRSRCLRQNTAVFNIQAVQGRESACLPFIKSTFSKMGNRESGEWWGDSHRVDRDSIKELISSRQVFSVDFSQGPSHSNSTQPLLVIPILEMRKLRPQKFRR